MNPLEYIAQSLEEWPLYLALLALFLALHAPMLRRWVVGIYDPLLVVLVTGALSSTLVAFMVLRDDAAALYGISFAACQLAFYGGLAIGRPGPRQVRHSASVAVRGAVPWVTLGVAAAVHIASTLATWGLAGIPLFRATRLGAFAGSGGFGILERLAESSGLISAFCAVYIAIASPRARRSTVLLLFVAWYLLSVAMSGSKGALLSLVQATLSVVYVYTSLREQPGRYWGGRGGKLLIGVSAAFAVAVLATQLEYDLTTAMIGLLVRIVSYGDVYIFAYPDATIEQLTGSSALVGMFGGFLSTFRLFPVDALQMNVGLQLTNLVFPDLELLVGPNPQHPVFGYHYLGFLAPVFSFTLGLVTTTTQRRLYHLRHSSFVGGLVAFLVYFTFVNIAIDFEYTLSRLASVLIGCVVILVPVLLLFPTEPVVRRAPLSGRATPPPG